jgi:hypothetical protein
MLPSFICFISGPSHRLNVVDKVPLSSRIMKRRISDTPLELGAGALGQSDSVVFLSNNNTQILQSVIKNGWARISTPGRGYPRLGVDDHARAWTLFFLAHQGSSVTLRCRLTKPPNSVMVWNILILHYNSCLRP